MQCKQRVVENCPWINRRMWYKIAQKRKQFRNYVKSQCQQRVVENHHWEIPRKWWKSPRNVNNVRNVIFASEESRIHRRMVSIMSCSLLVFDKRVRSDINPKTIIYIYNNTYVYGYIYIYKHNACINSRKVPCIACIA